MRIIEKGKDGYYHPANEEELQQLVLHAHDTGIQLRVRGSQHSVAQAIYTDGYTGSGAPPASTINVMLDKYAGHTITPDPEDPRYAIAELEAGCHLGRDPYDPTHTSTWENSLNYNLQKAGYALDDLGGISHQTISGFISTGSSGGSVKYSVYNNIQRIRLIDGTGKIHDLSRNDPDPAKRDMFFAAAISMGLLGVISKVWLRAGPTFNIFGKQVTTQTKDANIDFFGDGTAQKPSLEEFWRKTPYTRLMWWPQNDFDRMQVWEAARLEPMPDFDRRPYLELGRAPKLASLAGSLFYTIIGNLDDLSVVPRKLKNWYAHLQGDIGGNPNQNACASPSAAGEGESYTLDQVLEWLTDRIEASLDRKSAKRRGFDPSSAEHVALIEAAGQKFEGAKNKILAKAITTLFKLLLDGILVDPVTQRLANWLKTQMPYIIDEILTPFVSEGTEYFWDSWMCGLPMDNQMDDQLWPTEFTELWIPIERTKEVMQALKTFYAAGGDVPLAYEHTGSFSCELYAAAECPFWMSPSYGTAVVRVDVFWFGLNAGSPSDVFYPRFWELLKSFDFRPHWGKVLPPPSPEWRDYYKRVCPKLEDFLALRSEFDPKQIFVSQYWRDNLGIEPRVPRVVTEEGEKSVEVGKDLTGA